VTGRRVKAARKFPDSRGWTGRKVFHQAKYQWSRGVCEPEGSSSRRSARTAPERWWVPPSASKRTQRMMVTGGCRMTGVPAQTTAEEVMAWSPTRVLSNGPGDPEDPRFFCDSAIEATKKFLANELPVVGICFSGTDPRTRRGGRTVTMSSATRCQHRLQDPGVPDACSNQPKNHGFAGGREFTSWGVRETTSCSRIAAAIALPGAASSASRAIRRQSPDRRPETTVRRSTILMVRLPAGQLRGGGTPVCAASSWWGR